MDKKKMTSRNVRERKKCLFDFHIALLAIIVLSPILLLLAGVVFLRMGRPVFFTQKRVGKDNEIFQIVKFRTMLTPTSDRQSDADRLTPFGKFLRSSSLDELPELWNVLRGEMSLVGPRPLLVQYLPLYSTKQARRHEVPPGITGWAQINGRNAISWDQKFALDIWYVDNQSLWLDIRIIALTVWKIIRREDISAKGEATMPYFTGNKEQEQDE